MGYFKYRQARIDMQIRTVERAIFEMKLQSRNNNYAISENTIFEAKPVKINGFILKTFIHNQFHSQRSSNMLGDTCYIVTK